jgi:hypothetical protein
MTSTDDDVAQLADVRRLHREGFSIRAIAERLGLSRSAVHRRLNRTARFLQFPDDDDYDDGTEQQSGGVDDLTPERMAEPFAFVGLDTVTDYRGRPAKDSDGRLLGDAPRWRDARGHSFGILDHWRYRQYLDNERDDREGAKRLAAERERQLADAGVWCDERGRWRQR